MNHTKAILVLIISYFIISPVINQAQDNGWTWLYPKPQGNTLRDIFIFDKNTAIAVGDLGTVIKTTDMGKSWNVQHHAGGSSTDLYSVHFTDKLHGWAAGGTWSSDDMNVLIKTVDGGKTWDRVMTKTTSHFQDVYFINNDTGFVVGKNGEVLRTTNGGNSWDERKMYDYTGSYTAIHRLNSIKFIDDTTGFTLGSGFYSNLVYKTEDCGKTWKIITTPMVLTGLNDICFVDKKNGFIIGEAGELLKTTDSGNSWTKLMLPEKYQTTEYHCFNSLFFIDSTTGYVAGGDMTNNSENGGIILQTADGGKSWKEINTSKRIGQLYKVRISEDVTGWITGQTGLLYRSTDNGNTWDTLQDGKSNWLTSVYFTDEMNGWAVGEKGTILHTSDGGGNWIRQNSLASGWLNDVCFTDKNNGWIVGDVNSGGYFALRTNDGGTTWTPELQGIGFQTVFFTSKDTGWAAGGKLLKTTDGGNSWFVQNIKINQKLYTSYFYSSNIGWVAGGGTIGRTLNGGESWDIAEIDSLLFIRSIYFVDENTGWAAGDYNNGKNMYKTEDGGVTWQQMKASIAWDISSIMFTTNTTGYITGINKSTRDSYIAKTSDGGASWVSQIVPSNKGVSKVFFINKDKGFAIGNGIFKKEKDDIVSVKNEFVTGNNSPKQMYLCQNYPNPFNPSTVISYQIPSGGRVILRVYDILGKVVATLVDEYKNEGRYSVKFISGNLPSGIYIYEIRSNSFVSSKKLLLMK